MQSIDTESNLYSIYDTTAITTITTTVTATNNNANKNNKHFYIISHNVTNANLMFYWFY